MTKEKKQPAKDFAYTGEVVDFDVEQAYRRGVEQGAHWACALIEDGMHERDVRKWITNRIHPWRLKIKKLRRISDNTVMAEPAPAPKRGHVM